MYILVSIECLMEVICEELEVICVGFSDVCCIEIMVVMYDIDMEELIVCEDVVVILLYEGYVKY